MDTGSGSETGLPALDLVVFEEASSSNASTPMGNDSNSIHLPSTSQGSNSNTQLVLAGQASTSSSMQVIALRLFLITKSFLSFQFCFFPMLYFIFFNCAILKKKIFLFGKYLKIFSIPRAYNPDLMLGRWCIIH